MYTISDLVFLDCNNTTTVYPPWGNPPPAEAVAVALESHQPAGDWSEWAPFGDTFVRSRPARRKWKILNNWQAPDAPCAMLPARMYVAGEIAEEYKPHFFHEYRDHCCIYCGCTHFDGQACATCGAI